MNYVDELLQEIANQFPNLDYELIDLYTLLALVRGSHVENKDVHDAWAVWRNATDPNHRSIIPFDELSPEVQDLDSKYRDGIIYAVRIVHNRHRQSR